MATEVPVGEMQVGCLAATLTSRALASSSSHMALCNKSSALDCRTALKAD